MFHQLYSVARHRDSARKDWQKHSRLNFVSLLPKKNRSSFQRPCWPGTSKLELPGHLLNHILIYMNHMFGLREYAPQCQWFDIVQFLDLRILKSPIFLGKKLAYELMKPQLLKGWLDFTYTYMYIYIHTHICIYIYIHICMSCLQPHFCCIHRTF